MSEGANDANKRGGIGPANGNADRLTLQGRKTTIQDQLEITQLPLAQHNGR